ncbi:unnamed protein product [Phytophthora lilii]|uniref:Unnamed protein product n=1 Tax=Phytophthora lilii TaxID=2077276 RepID=A0A9W6TYA2_9STRA|nr:unnamed protein product [Phytophthora lilii]
MPMEEAQYVEAFSSVLLSDHPEEVLCGTSRGDVTERFAMLRCGAKIVWELNVQGKRFQLSRTLAFPSAMQGVWTFSSDEASELVNVVIPGIGHCLVHREDLEYEDEQECPPHKQRLTSLTIQFDKHRDERENRHNIVDDESGV